MELRASRPLLFLLLAVYVATGHASDTVQRTIAVDDHDMEPKDAVPDNEEGGAPTKDHWGFEGDHHRDRLVDILKTQSSAAVLAAQGGAWKTSKEVDTEQPVEVISKDANTEQPAIAGGAVGNGVSLGQRPSAVLVVPTGSNNGFTAPGPSVNPLTGSGIAVHNIHVEDPIPNPAERVWPDHGADTTITVGKTAAADSSASSIIKIQPNGGRTATQHVLEMGLTPASSVAVATIGSGEARPQVGIDGSVSGVDDHITQVGFVTGSSGSGPVYRRPTMKSDDPKVVFVIVDKNSDCAKAATLIKSWDQDGDGDIDMNEMVDGMKQMGMKEEDARRMWIDDAGGPATMSATALSHLIVKNCDDGTRPDSFGMGEFAKDKEWTTAEDTGPGSVTGFMGRNIPGDSAAHVGGVYEKFGEPDGAAWQTNPDRAPDRLNELAMNPGALGRSSSLSESKQNAGLTTMSTGSLLHLVVALPLQTWEWIKNSPLLARKKPSSFVVLESDSHHAEKGQFCRVDALRDPVAGFVMMEPCKNVAFSKFQSLSKFHDEGTFEIPEGGMCELKEKVCGANPYLSYPFADTITCKCKSGKCSFETLLGDDARCHYNWIGIIVCYAIDIIIINLVGFSINKLIVKPELDAMRGVTRHVGLVSIMAASCFGCCIFLYMPLDEATLSKGAHSLASSKDNSFHSSHHEEKKFDSRDYRNN